MEDNKNNMDKKEEKENGDCSFVYFIETHDKTKKFTISLSSEYEGQNTLEKVKDKEGKKDENEVLSQIYRFKIIPGSLKKDEEQKYQILVYVEDENDKGQQHEYCIKFSDEKKNIYNYDFNIQEIDIQPLSHEEQFEIYVEILRKVYNKKVNTKENEDLMTSTGQLLEEEGKKFNFFFYLLIFLECFKTKYIQQHLLNFKPQKIEGIGKIPETKIKLINNTFKIISKDPTKFLNLEDAKDEIELIELFYSILLYFNMNFQKEKVLEMFNDDKILTYLSKKLISFHDLYQELVLPRNIVRKLITKAKTFKEILGFLHYIGKDIIEFLQLICTEIEYIKNIYKIENEENEKKGKKDMKKMEKINVDEYVIPKLEDNILKILEILGLIYANIFVENLNILSFSNNIFEKYLDFYNGKDLQNIQVINRLINMIKTNDKSFDFKYNNKDMDSIIHETGLELIKRGKMKNKEILDFITSDTYFINKSYKAPIYRPLEIFDGIDISALEENFFKSWHIIKFQNIFDGRMYYFYEKISSLIKEMKDFGLLFEFYIYDNSKEYNAEQLKIMKKKYKELFPTYSPEKCPNFVDDTINLISHLDKKKIDIKDLLEFIQNNLNIDQVNDIYLKLSDKNKNLTDKTKEAIVGYFTTNKNNSNPTSLIFLIKNCKNLRNDIFSKINSYILSEKDFLSPEETENFKLYKGLIDNNILDKDIQYKGASYIIKSITTISALEEKIKNFDIKYADINIFFQNKKMNNVLIERLKYLNMLDQVKTEKNFANLEYKLNEIKSKLDDFELIFADFRDFFYQKYHKDLDILTNICYNLKNQSLNYFEKSYTKEYEYYSKFLNEAKKRNNYKKSTFFNEILKYYQKNIYKNDEEKALKETENSFNELKIIFEDEKLTKVDEKIMEICIVPFRENEENLKKELKILCELFNVNGNLDKIYEGILLFSKREFIFNTASAISNFIEKVSPKKTGFLISIKDIILKLQENKDIETIKICNNKLFELHIFDGKEKENKLINILIKFKEQPESILFLLETKVQEVGNLQEIASLNENNMVNVNDILDMGKCIEFFNNIGTLEELRNMEDSEIIEKLNNHVKGKKDIDVYFTNYINNFGQIKLLKSSVNTSEFLKYKIQALFNGCIFIISNNKDSAFECHYNEINKEKKEIENILSIGEIISLRERALLAKKISPEYKYFIDSIGEIINISNILKNLYICGYTKIIQVRINYKVKVIKKENEEVEINPSIEYILDNQNKNNFKEIVNEIKKILSELKEKQLDGYMTKPLIRYIYGRQFNLLYNNLENKNNEQIIPILKYITNDNCEKQVEKFKRGKNGDLIENNIQDCENYLKEVLNKNKLTMEKIYQDTIINKKNLNINTGIFTYICESPEKNLFQIYKYLTGKNPIAQNILLCNKKTSNEQITAFLYRAIFCEFNSCFIIAGIELLETEKRTTIIDLLNENFQGGNRKINSCLIFLYKTNNSDIYKSLETKRYRQILELNQKNYNEIIYENDDIEIIKSDKSGVGKSTQIKLDIQKLKKNYIYFPFGGAFSQEDLISRLKNLKIDNNCALHLDLYDTDQTTLMMEFLFSILITRFYGQNEDVFFLSKNIPIKVEIPNTFINFFEKFPILNLFKIKEMKIAQLAPLIVPKDISCNIEVVANYLKSLKENKINDYDLIFPNITPVDFAKRTYKYKKQVYTTSIQPELISDENCQKLIFEIIKDKIKEPTYYQIISFINVLAVQLKKLNQNFFLNAFTLKLSGKLNICQIRTFIVQSFINLTKHFTEGAFADLLKGQDIVSNSRFGIYDENKDLNNAINNLAKDVKDVISFDKIDPSLLFFHEKTSQLFSIITNKSKEDQEYKNLLSLKNSQFEKGKELFKELPNYLKYDQNQFLEELKNILDIPNPVSKKEKSERISLEEIAGDYIFTADNFVKMVLILIRLRSGIPVIMMGETGCGKTSLIRKLSQMKNNGKIDKMKILNIHAGTNDNDIIKFINESVIPDAIKISNEEKELKESYKKMGQIFEDTKLWVFLDEINTCKSMGLISELMCKHTCQGIKLPDNIVFIAACNPYRMRETKEEEKEIGLDINQAHNQIKQLNQKELEDIKEKKSGNLVYTVNPLPHSLLNFVFYFGNLKPADEQNYIKCIIKKVIEKIYYNGKEPIDEKNEDEKITKLKGLAFNMIWAAQQFIREFSDKSAVSLREIRRVNIFYEFFYQYLTSRREFYIKEDQIQLFEDDYDFYKNLDDYSMQVYAINLSIFVCYYLRVTNKERRNELRNRMNAIFNNFDKKFESKDFLDLPLNEEKFIVNNIKLDKGIAKNRALLENIFSLFVGINSKVPIFIVGKPGCSKSLSFQLITKSMQGSASDKPFFKKLPRTIIHSYQGSLASTSKGVENVFFKARETLEQLKDDDRKRIISLIYFDEMGLAEHSPNNPLKVIHAELEYDQNEGNKKVAFVGISNWSLDAAKMNRGISISIPEPDEEDNKETAFTIGNSYDEVMADRYKNFFENLGICYFKYKKYLKENHSIDGKDDFHGNRDFYHLVKNAARNMIEKEKQNPLNDQTLLECAINSIERNFSGIQFSEKDIKASLEIFKGIFHEIYPACPVIKEYDVLKRIKENINDLNSRYLLISSDSSMGIILLSSILESESKDYSFYIGSPFEDDLNSEEYALKVLNKIQAHMERGNILILKNLETVYPSMYDLFNQNFTVMGNKNYSRLAVGSNTNTFAYVDKNFRCIVNVETSKLDEEEAPFLNRFEKHIMSFEYLMEEELIKEADKIKNTIDGFFKCNNQTFKAINYNLNKLMINCSKEEIQALVYHGHKSGVKKENLSDFVLEKISNTLPQDILVNLKISGPKQAKNLKKILEFYNKGEHCNFSQFLANAKNHKNIIYTFSSYLDELINKEDKVNNALVGEIKKENLKIIQLDSIKSEREFENNIDDYLNEENYKVCIIKFLPYQGSFMNYIKYFIENKENEKKIESKKIYIFIVYMSRISIQELKDIDKKTIKEKEEFNQKILKETLSNLSGFYQIFIDNLNGNPKHKIEKILNMKKNELFNNLINPDEELCSGIFQSISYMKYDIIAPYKGLNRDTYINKILELITNKKRLRDLINETLFKQSFKGKEDIITKIFKEKNSINEGDIEIISVIKRYLSKIYINQLTIFYFKAEKEQFFSSLLSNSIEQELWPTKKIDNKNEEEELIKEKEEIYEDKTLIEKLAKTYLEQVVYNDNITKISPIIGGNKVDIIFGLKIPGIKPILDNILKLNKENILKDYQNNENELRDFYYEDEVEEKKKEFFSNLKMLNNSLLILINKDERLKSLLSVFENNIEDENKIYDLLLEDYYSLFLNNHINDSKKKENEDEQENFLVIDNLDNNKKFLNLMVEIRNNTINSLLDQKDIQTNRLYIISSIINWVESYSEEITSLQQIFLKLNMKIPELFEQIEKIISSGLIQYEISERNPEYTSIVNQALFLSLDSILRIITSKVQIYELPLDDFFDLINTNKEVLQKALQLETSLKLRSKEVFSLQEILKLINALYLNNLANVKNVTTIIQYFSEQTNFIQKKAKDRLISQLDKFYDTLVKMMGNLPSKKNFDFYKLLSIILLDEFNKINYPEFRMMILQKILKKNELIKNSSQIIKIIIDNAGIENDPLQMAENMKNIQVADSKMFIKLNETNNPFLEEIIMNIFERKIMKYFELFPTSYPIKNKTEIIFGSSLQIFKDTINYLDSSLQVNNKNKKSSNFNLLKLYSIVYVKLYLYHVTNFIVNNFKDMGNIKEIIDCINKIKRKEFSKVIKIYTLKLIFNLKNNNFEEFKNFEFEKCGLNFYKELQGNKKSGDIMLTYFFLPSDKEDFKKYEDILDAFMKNSNFNENNKGLENLLDKNGLDLFLLLIFNKIISNLALSNFDLKDSYKNFCNYAKSIFEFNRRKILRKDLMQLLFLFFDSMNYRQKTRPKISDEKGKIDSHIFEALLYGFRFCVNSLLFEKGENQDIKSFLFASMLSKDCQRTIEKSFIPGNDNKEDLHITTLESIKFHFDTFSDAHGCYVCSCGFYYNIDPCGFPTTNRTFKCPDCGLKLGWDKKVIKDKGATNHGMVIRPGHYRIFKDLNQKVKQMSRWHDPDENIPNIIYADYIKKVIEPIRNKSGTGFNVVDRDYFQNREKKIRKLSNIGYRILNLISYCHLFFSYCMGNITQNKFNEYLIKNCNILNIIEIDWKCLKEALQQKNIGSVQIFLNMIFKDLSKLIRECKILTKEANRENFETQVEDLISNYLKKYSEYSKIYNEENKKQSDLDIDSLKTLVTELIPPHSESYNEKEYPLFKYFLYTKYKTEEDMMKRMNNKDSYPLIKQFVSGSPDVKNLVYLPAFNEFTNFMVNYYSFKISRDDAKTKILADEEIMKEDNFKKKFDSFIEAWEHIKSKAIKYKCRPEMEVKEKFSKNDTLINFLNDGGELYNGMYLAAACQNFIEWQNTFLQPIVDANAFNGILHNYVNSLLKKVPVQDAKHDQILLIKESFAKRGNNIIDFTDLIYSFSERNIFEENGNINYSDYNTFVYDYDRIEEELGKIILPGLCLFEGEESLNFITYWGEGFRGGNHEMITKFYIKYPQKDLEFEEKKEVKAYISKMNKSSKNKEKKYDFKPFFGSLQILLFYLTEKGIMKEDEKIGEIIQNAPSYLNISNDCKNFFYNEGYKFTINKLMNLFFFFEHLCFEDLADSLQLEYKAQIPEDLKNKIIENLLNKKDPFDIISTRDLSAATRRLISRYLAGKLATTDINENNDLSFELGRAELWEEKIGNLEDLVMLVIQKLKEFKLKVGQAYEFYNIIGDEDKNSLII